MNIWRFHTKLGKKRDASKVANFWLDNNEFGTGWKVNKSSQNIDLIEWKSVIKQHMNNNNELSKSQKIYWIKRMINMLNYLDKIQPGDLILIRRDGLYYVGKAIKKNGSLWHYYNNSEDRNELDTHLVCNVDKYYELGLIDSIPTKVVNNFRAPRAISRIKDDDGFIAKYLEFKYESLKNNTHQATFEPIGKESFMRSVLLPEDQEELISLYLQIKKHYLLFSSSNKLDTEKYEFVMTSIDGKTKAIVQAKTGNIIIDSNSFKNLSRKNNDLSGDNQKLEVYLYDQKSRVINVNKLEYSTKKLKIVRISEGEILSFILEHQEIMPSRIKTWWKLVK